MEEIVLENEAVYWRGNLVSFSAAHFNKVVITEKRKRTFCADLRRQITENRNKSGGWIYQRRLMQRHVYYPANRST